MPKTPRLLILGTGWGSYSVLKFINKKLYEVAVVSALPLGLAGSANCFGGNGWQSLGQHRGQVQAEDVLRDVIIWLKFAYQKP